MIAVVHLVWGPLGPAPLQRFLDSYRRRPAGAAHELVVLLNGMGSADREAVLEPLREIPHRVLELSEPAQDLDAYRQAAARLEHEKVCFLNSYSEILAEDWLAKLDACLEQPGAGMVGFTGSWSSLHSAALNALYLPSAYRGLLPSRSVIRQQTFEVETGLGREREGAVAPGPSPGRLSASFRARAIARALRTIPEQLVRFEPFPACHLRTNGFMLDRKLMCSLRMPPVRRKMDAYLLESGRHSLTRQIQRQGRRTLVVDREGRGYDHERWDRSLTLWQGAQEGLMVADNQTRSYQEGGIERRRMLSALAWGSAARPSFAQEPARR